jgi:hypothetical protein
MPKTISSAKGRIWLMVVIAVCFVVALVILFSVFGGGAIGSENQSNAVFKILGFYVPLLTLIATFYFKENLGGTSSDTPLETFIVAVFIILIWAVTPIILFMRVKYVEDILGYIDKLVPVGQSIALMALGYYFTKKPSA